jgi:ribonuclease III
MKSENKKSFSDLTGILGVSFSDQDLLKKAFVHRSYVNEHPNEVKEHNERLEFLGEKSEAELTALRAALVNTSSLSKCANKLGLEAYLLLSRGEEKSRGRARQYILANTFEAFVGAVYLDQGYQITHNFVAKYLLPNISTIIKNRLWEDAKSRFQEMAQEEVGITPTYSILAEIGPDHDKIFTVGLHLEDILISKGRGNSKQEAEQEAARKGLIIKGWE